MLKLSAVAICSLVVHLQSRRLHTSASVSNLSHRNHSTSILRTSQQRGVVQQLPAVLVEGVTTSRKGFEAQLNSHVCAVVECPKLSREASSDLSCNALSKQIVNSQVKGSIDVDSVLRRSALLVKLNDDVINIGHCFKRASRDITSFFYCAEVTFRASSTQDAIISVSKFVREQHHHLTLVHETLTSLLLTIHEPSVVTVASVDVSNVGCLRAIHLETLFNNHERVDKSVNSRLRKSSGLVGSLSIHVTDNCKLLGCYPGGNVASKCNKGTRSTSTSHPV